MDCEHRDQLLDLVYGELEDAEATVLRRRAEACEGCRDELARLDEVKRLADQLVVEPMPLTAHNLIMAAAKEAAQKSAQSEPVAGSWWAGALVWIQTTLAKPQLAMALVMLGVVAVGVYFVPGDELARHEIEEIVADPETSAELSVPETETETEAELETETELEDGEAIEPEVRVDEPDLESPAEDVEPEVDRDETRRTRRDPPTMSVRTRATATPTEAEVAAARREAEHTQIEGSLLDLGELRTEEGSMAVEPDVATRPQTRETQAQAQQTEPAPMPVTERATTPARNSTNTIEPLRGNRATYERAMTEYRGGDFRSAAQEFERVVRSPDDDVRQLLPSALHHLARSHRSQGACSTAVQHYARLFERYPAYAQLPQALIEAADCYRREGNLSQARALLYRAEGYASTEAAAQRELRRIETLQRAQRRSAPAPAQADSVESAY